MHPRTRWEYLEVDYLDKLSPEEKAWLSKFNEEFVGGSFSADNDRNLHKSVEEKRECYGRNNAQNRDLFAINHSWGWVGDVAETPENLNQEDVLVSLIDGEDGGNKPSN